MHTHKALNPAVVLLFPFSPKSFSCNVPVTMVITTATSYLSDFSIFGGDSCSLCLVQLLPLPAVNFLKQIEAEHFEAIINISVGF